MFHEHNQNNEAEEQSVLGGIVLGVFKYDVRVFLISLRRRLPFLLLIPLVIFAMTVIYVYSLPKNWQSTCILFKSAAHNVKEELSTKRKPLSNEVIKDIIRVKDNMRQVIENLKLPATLQQLYGATDVRISDDNKNMIKISALSHDPNQAAAIANELAKVFLSKYEKMRNRTVQKRFDYFSHQKIIIMDKISNLEAEKKAYLEKHGISALALEESKDFEDLNKLDVKITLAEQKQHALKIQIKEYYEQMHKLEPEVKISYEVTTVDDTALVLKKNELDSLRQRYTDENPKVKKIISEIKALENKIEKEKKEKRPPQKITYGKNWRLTKLEEEAFKVETELKSIEFSLNKYKLVKNELNKRIKRLNKTANEYNEIKRKILLNKALLKKIDMGVTEMGLALSSSVSDLRIFEKAEPSVYPTVNKKKKLVIIGFVLGLMIAGGVAVLLEVIDLTVKSQFDIENVLHINALGSLPKINEVRLKKFYASTQVVFTRIFKTELETEKKNVLIAFGDVEGKTGKTFFIKKCIDVFGPMDKKILYISSCNELASGLLKYKINDFIYNDQKIDSDLARENNDHLYFLLDNYSYIVPIKEEQIKKFVDKFSEYDFIFWELFEFKKNEPLFAAICSVAENTVLMTRFKKSKKLALVKCITYLKEHSVKNIGAIVNSVEKRYFTKGV